MICPFLCQVHSSKFTFHTILGQDQKARRYARAIRAISHNIWLWEIQGCFVILGLGEDIVAQKNLQTAKHQKNDEFYTQLVDIENELKHYKKWS